MSFVKDSRIFFFLGGGGGGGGGGQEIRIKSPVNTREKQLATSITQNKIKLRDHGRTRDVELREMLSFGYNIKLTVPFGPKKNPGHVLFVPVGQGDADLSHGVINYTY